MYTIITLQLLHSFILHCVIQILQKATIELDIDSSSMTCRGVNEPSRAELSDFQGRLGSFSKPAWRSSSSSARLKNCRLKLEFGSARLV